MIQVFWNAKTGMVLSRNLRSMHWTLHTERGGVALTDKGAQMAIAEGCGADWQGNPNWRVKTINLTFDKENIRE